jgi:hypothetical protein
MAKAAVASLLDCCGARIAIQPGEVGSRGTWLSTGRNGVPEKGFSVTRGLSPRLGKSPISTIHRCDEDLVYGRSGLRSNRRLSSSNHSASLTKYATKASFSSGFNPWSMASLTGCHSSACFRKSVSDISF